MTEFTYKHESEVVRAALGIMAARCGERQKFQDPKDVMVYMRLKLGESDREQFFMFTLDAQHRMIGEHLITQGTHDVVMPFPRELLGAALKDGADYVVFVHNHPSAKTAQPSKNDCAMTMQVMQLFGACDIAVLDHIIVTAEDQYSMAIAGVMGKLHEHATAVAENLKARADLIIAIGVPE